MGLCLCHRSPIPTFIKCYHLLLFDSAPKEPYVQDGYCAASALASEEGGFNLGDLSSSVFLGFGQAFPKGQPDIDSSGNRFLAICGNEFDTSHLSDVGVMCLLYVVD